MSLGCFNIWNQFMYYFLYKMSAIFRINDCYQCCCSSFGWWIFIKLLHYRPSLVTEVWSHFFWHHTDNISTVSIRWYSPIGTRSENWDNNDELRWSMFPLSHCSHMQHILSQHAECLHTIIMPSANAIDQLDLPDPCDIYICIALHTEAIVTSSKKTGVNLHLYRVLNT